MKDCPRCNTEHNKPGLFCSRTCANSRSWSDDDKALKKKRALEHYQTPEFKQRARDRLNNISLEKRAERKEKARQTIMRRHATLPWERLGWDTKRKLVLQQQGGACAECALTEWRGFPICLEVDHLDGDRQNNARENLKAVCPNCHSITPTWRGKKLKVSDTVKVTDDQILAAIARCESVHEALNSLGIAPKGRNYARVTKLLYKSFKKE